MIYIKNNNLNKVCLTLSEEMSDVNNYFLFEFESDFNKSLTPNLFITTDISNSTIRYNLFNINVNDNGVHSGIDVTLLLIPGQYTYNIYETTTFDIDKDNIVKLLETGRMIVDGINTTIDPIYN